jgi:hypothetical protein
MNDMAFVSALRVDLASGPASKWAKCSIASAAPTWLKLVHPPVLVDGADGGGEVLG